MGQDICKHIQQSQWKKLPYEIQQDKEQIEMKINNQSQLIQKLSKKVHQEFEICQRRPLLPEIIINQMESKRSMLNGARLEGYPRGTPNDKYYKFRISGNIYQGQWKDDKPHGRGILFFAKGSVFEGAFLEGIPFGYGQFFMKSGGVYEGFVKYGRANGLGSFYQKNYLYRGNFKDDQKHGEGEEQDLGKYYFRGQFQNGEKKKGFYKYSQFIYEGQFQNDQFNGKGKLISEDGSHFEGKFKDGKFHGYGVFLWKNGSQYRGQYYKGERDGDGEYFNSENNSLSKGIWKMGVLNGVGTYQDSDKKIIKCVWNNSKITKLSH